MQPCRKRLLVRASTFARELRRAAPYRTVLWDFAATSVATTEKRNQRDGHKERTIKGSATALHVDTPHRSAQRLPCTALLLAYTYTERTPYGGFSSPPTRLRSSLGLLAGSFPVPWKSSCGVSADPLSRQSVSTPTRYNKPARYSSPCIDNK